MYFPPQLYQLDPKGLAGGLLELWNATLSVNQAAAQHQSALNSFLVPNDRVVLLHAVNGTYTAGAAQTLRSVIVNELRGGVIIANVYTGIRQVGGGSIDAPIMAFTGYVLRPGTEIQITVNYDAGAAANTSFVTVQGIAIPRGKIALAGGN